MSVAWLTLTPAAIRRVLRLARRVAKVTRLSRPRSRRSDAVQQLRFLGVLCARVAALPAAAAPPAERLAAGRQLRLLRRVGRAVPDAHLAVDGGRLCRRAAHRRRGDSGRPTGLAWLSVATNLGVLGIFKYSGFFAEQLAALLSAVGVPIELPVLQLVLPVGISFYTFQTLSYTIDVYRGESVSRHAIAPRFRRCTSRSFRSSWPVPIERYVPPRSRRVAEDRRLDREAASKAAFTTDRDPALFKKAADRRQPRSPRRSKLLHAQPDITHPVASAWIGTYAFALQIYCDFSAYSDDRPSVSRRLLGLRPDHAELPRAVRRRRAFRVLATLAHLPVDSGCATTSTSRWAATAAARPQRAAI